MIAEEVVDQQLSGSPFVSVKAEDDTKKKPLENMLVDASQGLVMAGQMTPMGMEHRANSQGNRLSGGDVPPYVPPSESITPDLIELIGLWDRLDESARDDLLRVARSWAASGKELGTLQKRTNEPPKTI